MNLYFADRRLDVKGMASTSIDALYQIINDTISDEIDTGIKILEFDIRYRRFVEISKLKDMLAEGNFIFYDGVLGQSCFTAIEVEHDPIEMNFHIYAEDAGLDMINEVAYASSAPNDGPKPISWYLYRLLSDDWRVGINEIPDDRTLSLSWSGESTVTERLSELATAFEAEITYRFDFRGLAINAKYIDLYKKRGKDIFKELRLGREIENIVEKRSIANLATALNPVGSSLEVNGEQTDPITLNGTSYDDGDFYVDGYLLKSRVALEKWGRYELNSGSNNQHTIRSFSYDTTDLTALLNQSIEELKKRREPEVTYQVSLSYLPENLSLGDTVYLIDDASELYLSARLLKIEISESDDTRTAEFGDYVVKSAGISDRLISIANDLMANFKPTYTWIAYADSITGNGISLSPTGKFFIGIAKNRPSKNPILDPTLYTWTQRDSTISEFENYSHYIHHIFDDDTRYYTIETDEETGIDYVVIKESGERYQLFEDEHGYRYYINANGITTYIEEAILIPMDRNEYDDYVDNHTSDNSGIYYVEDANGDKQVRIVSEKINTSELFIDGMSIADFITSQVGYQVKHYSATYSIDANGIVNLTASQLQISTPQDYTPVAVLSARSGNGNVAVRTFNGAATGNTAALCLKNVFDSPYSNLEASFDILYLSTNLSGGGGGGGGGGTMDYNALYNKPQIDEVTLQGNRDLYITNTEIDNLINLTIPGV